MTMKKIFLLFSLTLVCHTLVSAQDDVDSLTKAYKKNKQDTTLVQLLDSKATERELQTNTDSGLLHTRQALALSRRIHYEWGEAKSLADMSNFLNEKGDLPGSLKATFEVLPMAIRLNDHNMIAECYNTLGLTYSTLKNSPKALEYYRKGLAAAVHSNLVRLIIIENNNISRQFQDMDQLDSALWYTNKAYALSLKKNTDDIGFLIRNFGTIQFKKGNYERAITFFKKSAAQPKTLQNHYLQGEDYRRMAEAYQKLNNLDSCIICAKIAYAQAQLENNPNQVMLVTSLLTDVYKAKNDYKQAYDYQQVMLKAQDSLFSQQKTLQVQNLTYSEQQRQDALKAAAIAYQDKVRFYALAGILAVVLLIMFILWFSNNARKKANRLLHQQNQQIQSQHQALEKTLAELNATQTQLVQREKMASLGELTAGIAHEIQNPLNFVNNFSEVNTEMLEELKAEIEKPKAERDEQLEVELINGLIENEKKINHHGKRADFIVKGMLQHSRTSTGEKQQTNINILADEFLKLSYHGLRAKDKSFNAELVTHFDANLPKVNIAQQDIGRVLLNLFNNAFYAVNQKQKTAGSDYKPEVTVSTSAEKNDLVIKVKDNGNGIPDAIKEKIMQPFFTTKPTGEGTGLGLSLSYDIVIKGHGGTLDVNSKEGEGSEFVVRLPLG
jgi:two-component system NtrC family sensor kinase